MEGKGQRGASRKKGKEGFCLVRWQWRQERERGEREGHKRAQARGSTCGALGPYLGLSWRLHFPSPSPSTQDKHVRLMGAHSVIGRSVVIKAQEDDLGRVRQTGREGGREGGGRRA